MTLKRFVPIVCGLTAAALVISVVSDHLEADTPDRTVDLSAVSVEFDSCDATIGCSPPTTSTTSSTSTTSTVPSTTVVVTTTTTAPTTTTPAALSGACGGWEELIGRYWPNNTGEACAVMWCESEGNPNAVSHTDDHGLFQLNRPIWEHTFSSVIGLPWNPGVYDPEMNVVFADWLYRDAGGWGPWVCAKQLGLV